MQINGCEVHKDREKAVSLLSSVDIRRIRLLVTRPEMQVNTRTRAHARARTRTHTHARTHTHTLTHSSKIHRQAPGVKVI